MSLKPKDAEIYVLIMLSMFIFRASKVLRILQPPIFFILEIDQNFKETDFRSPDPPSARSFASLRTRRLQRDISERKMNQIRRKTLHTL